MRGVSKRLFDKQSATVLGSLSTVASTPTVRHDKGVAMMLGKPVQAVEIWLDDKDCSSDTQHTCMRKFITMLQLPRWEHSGAGVFLVLLISVN